ncbi:methionyl-tRNA formyltransferase [Candidatus Omnitrophota bacterium]
MKSNDSSIVYFGSDEFSLITLERLKSVGVSISLVITTLARPAGRGLQLRKSVISEFCHKYKIDCIEVNDLHDEGCMSTLEQHRNEVFVVVSFGKILSQAILTISKYGVINLHPSLLPRWRGPAPIQSALCAGDTITGISIIQLTQEIDAGDILTQEEILIDEVINAQDLEKKLACKGAELLKSTIGAIYEGRVTATPQEVSGITYAQKLTKDDGRINWNESSTVIHNKIRGLYPWPSAFTRYKGKILKIFSSSPSGIKVENACPGEIIAINKEGSVSISTGNGTLDIFEVQLEGKKCMNAFSFSLGARLSIGECLGDIS